MDFFDTPEPPDMGDMHHEQYAMPEWMAAPSNVLPSLVPIEHVIGRSDDAVVLLSGIRAFTASWDFSLVAKRRPGSSTNPWDDPTEFHPMMMHPGMYPPGAGPDLESMLRYGFQFSDGSKVTSTSHPNFEAMRGTNDYINTHSRRPS